MALVTQATKKQVRSLSIFFHHKPNTANVHTNDCVVLK